ncbi:MAG: hypothetical protein GC152_02695 [Alphaproteobacteria bacterium]|nr:hypothetical protein [Alphaproteobacteria bacterium]
MAGILAGIATIGAGVALYRFLDRKTREATVALEEIRRRGHGGAQGAVLDYCRDPADGVYRPKP